MKVKRVCFTSKASTILLAMTVLTSAMLGGGGGGRDRGRADEPGTEPDTREREPTVLIPMDFDGPGRDPNILMCGRSSDDRVHAFYMSFKTNLYALLKAMYRPGEERQDLPYSKIYSRFNRVCSQQDLPYSKMRDAVDNDDVFSHGRTSYKLFGDHVFVQRPSDAERSMFQVAGLHSWMSMCQRVNLDKGEKFTRLFIQQNQQRTNAIRPVLELTLEQVLALEDLIELAIYSANPRLTSYLPYTIL